MTLPVHSPPPTHTTPPPLRRALLIALSVCLVGSAVLTLLELAASLAMIRPRMKGSLFPASVVMAAYGKIVLTYFLASVTLIFPAALAHWFLRKPRPNAAPEPFLWALFILLAGFIVLPADLAMTNRDKPKFLIPACAGTILLALFLFFATHYLLRRWGTRRLHRIALAKTLLAALVAVPAIACFLLSPAYNPTAFRVAQPAARSSAPAATSSTRPNVLWIMLDTVRADRMSCHGYSRPTTPFLDEFARSAAVFDTAVSNAVWTVPSHASMFTGLPLRSHATDWGHTFLENDFDTIAERLRDEGCATAMFTNNPWFSPETNLTQGFSDLCNVYHLRRLQRFSLEYLVEKWGLKGPLPWFDGDFGAAQTNQLISDWLDDHAEDAGPRFLFAHFMEAHLPYRVPREYRAMFMSPEQVDRSYQLREKAYGTLTPTLDTRFNIDGGDFLPASDREILNRQYDAAVRYLDDRARELVAQFESRGLLDNTLVIISSDHGEYLGAHDLWAHRFLTYNDLSRVGLLVREPGRTTPARINTPVQLSDIYHTIAAALHLPSTTQPPPGAHNLLALAASGGAPAIAITEYSGGGPETADLIKAKNDPELTHKGLPQTALFDGRWKFMLSTDGREELYDQLADPAELHNLARENPAETRHLAQRRLADWLNSVPRHIPKDNAQLPPDLTESLRGLGYIDAGK